MLNGAWQLCRGVPRADTVGGYLVSTLLQNNYKHLLEHDAGSIHCVSQKMMNHLIAGISRSYVPTAEHITVQTVHYWMVHIHQ